ncbi:Prepilin-type N-terminal cleavage/methylation domain-containing protein [Desulfonema limicola]|uniref:Prepilin-type N-terminal cleavage/methylation domain-containing protein n=1 Tax=Desulfonema limicola TaxID=45656 RepID=A0A975BCG6_9BACT|nr:prepilin-type N-terminal cleavage/methylation domain-containing protein [Desulfonema limicola]QTA82659.1 Prepilin-type N-terminal cleavage/methylation domain-containing protein [Desulfonema limicola]
MFRQNIKHKNRIGNHAGFTLIEVLIAMVVLSIGLLAIAGMHISSIRGNKTAEEITSASNEALASFENALATDYENDLFVSTDYSTEFPKYDLTAGKGKLVDDKYILAYEIKENDKNDTDEATDTTLEADENPLGGYETKTLIAHVMWYDQTGCQTTDCVKLYPEAQAEDGTTKNNIKFNKKITTTYIIPLINK